MSSTAGRLDKRRDEAVCSLDAACEHHEDLALMRTSEEHLALLDSTVQTQRMEK